MPLAVEQLDPERCVIAVSGDADLYTAPEFREKLINAIAGGAKKIVVDLSDATFVDSTMLGVLVDGNKRLQPAGGRLTLACTDRTVRKIFEVTGLDRIFGMHGSRDEALGSLG